MQWRLLVDVPDEQVRLLLTVARRRRFARGEVVFHHDDPADSFHLVSTGHFAVRLMSRIGDKVTIVLLGPGEHFGEMALVTPGERRSATVEALETSETFAIYESDFAELRRQQPSIDRILVAALADEVRLLHARLLETLFVPADRRVLLRLVELAPIYRKKADADVELPLTQEELAAFAGTSRATVNRVLRDEQQRGTIELRRGKTVILDLEGLRKKAR